MSIGGGGGLLSGIAGVVGGMFGGPIGAIVGQVLGQVLQQVAGQVLQQVGQQLGNVSQQAQQAGQQLLGNQAGGDLARTVNDFIAQVGGGTPSQVGDLNRAIDDLKKAITDFVNQMMQDTVQNGKGSRGGRGGEGASGGGGATGGGGASGAEGSAGTGGVDSSSDSSGDDFFMAMAKALGKEMQKQADKVKALSDQIGQGDDKKNAETQTKLMGESQKMQFLSTAVQTALSAVGQALSTLARSQ
ncbi:hypothetical protein [Dokdonella sp.]|uniref:hypothetical protein n=1 Tax=Dokdonella sp. TaxID=2291710 RepID=UPI001B29CA52|nr:hypothetical protein [Dokdonella sp.]MBO9664257.1 hypothetical protein [Dokdonella sp.]